MKIFEIGLIVAVASGSPLEKAQPSGNAGLLKGEVVDADSGDLIEARVTIQRNGGEWFFPRSAAENGTAIEYRRDRGRSVEMHTTLSAHPFEVNLPPGTYTLTGERGKEYLPTTKSIEVGSGTQEIQLRLKRWIDMASLGWYSGDTHVHRTPEELSNVMLAEDLNVAFPLTYWVWDAYKVPPLGEKDLHLEDPVGAVEIDPTHVFYPLNTEYEITRVGGKPHVLGAFFVLNHKTPFAMGGPPVAPIAEKAHREGGLLELDKHNWPWSMMLVPVMGVDLYELTNNHLWRTEFLFSDFGEPAPEYMNVETTAEGFTERGWMDFGFQNYYALLNCGFRLRPTAGTASGVHPVPLGFGRVYVHLTDGFSYDRWVDGLNAGRSFVTTGPMLFVELDGKDPGHRFEETSGQATSHNLSGQVVSESPVSSIEIVRNGEVIQKIEPVNASGSSGEYRNAFEEEIRAEESCWLAVRCFERIPGGRFRFAHTGPFYFEAADKPLRPRKREVRFLVDRIEAQIARNEGILSEVELEEYREALERYRSWEALAVGD